MRARNLSALFLLAVFTSLAHRTLAQASLPLYTDNLVNAFQDWSWNSTRNFTNASPVHSGSGSIAVTITSSGGALSLQYGNGFSTAPYASLSFWINGGAGGGQRLKVYGTLANAGQTAYALPTLGTTWQQFTIPLSSLGVANKTGFTGIYIQDNSGGAQATFYVDDIQLNAAPAPTAVHLSIDANKTNRLADGRWFGINTATWDGNLSQQTTTIGLLREAGCQALRWPGGSTSDAYHWASDSTGNARFNNIATNLGVQAFITVNYGSGTSNEAAAWVKSVNATNHYGFKYWEIGNECYGSWENDVNTPAHDPYTYAVRAAGYIQMMKAADPTIKIGAVATPGEDSYANNTTHPATNPRTGQVHNGWTPVMLATFKSLGVMPDFLIHHVYPEWTNPVNPPPVADSDPLLLQSTVNWASDAANLRQQLSDYIGAPATNIELCATENNSDSSSAFGKQLTSVVNALYLADAACQVMKTEFNSYFWWDLRNGHNSTGTFDPTIYGWRTYGDEGMIDGVSGKYPMFYAEKILQFFVRPGDTVLNSTSDYLLVAAYAARRADGSLSLLVINKDVTTSFSGQISISNFVPSTAATVRSYGILQDEATRTNAPAAAQDISTNSAAVSGLFTYSFPPGSLTVFSFTPQAAPAITTVALGTSATPATYGASVTFTATVRTNGIAVGGIAGESIAFYDGGTTQIGTGTLNAGGQAAYTPSASQLFAGTHSITASYSGDALYLGSTNSTPLSQVITAASVTAGLTGTVSKKYDSTVSATLAATNYTLSGVVNGDTVTLNNPPSGTYDTANVGSDKTVAVAGLAISGASATNYTLSSTSASGAVGTITSVTLTYLANAANMTYGGSVPALSGSVGGFVGGDNQANATTGTMIFATTATSSSSVGNYPINGSGLTANNGNYIFAQAPGNATALTLGPLAVSLSGTRAYDGTTAAAAGILSVANRLGSDNVTVASGSGVLAGAAVGTEALSSVGTLQLGGTAASNYTLIGAGGSVNVTAAGLLVTNLLALDKVYDATTNATLNATNAGLTGVFAGDNVTLISTNAVGYFADKNVGTNKPVTVSGLALGGDSATNYNLAQPTNLTANITAASLTVTGVTAADKVFDGTTIATLAGTAVLSGVLGNDIFTLVTSNASASFSDADPGMNKDVTVAGYSVAGADSANYLVIQPAGLTANILPLVIPVLSGISLDWNGWELSLSAQAGQKYEVLASSDLTLPLNQWSVLTNAMFGAAAVVFTDTETNLPARFYRIVSP